MLEKKERLAGVELFKIIAIALIVLSHVTQTLSTVITDVQPSDYVIKLGVSTTNIQVVILNIFRQMGALGNNIFFIASAWFFIDRERPNRKKAMSIMCNIWAISIIYLIIFMALKIDGMTTTYIIKSLLPTTFANNWYMTLYIIFLFAYPWMNKLIASLSQKEHLRIVMFSTLLWIIAGLLKKDLFFTSDAIVWMTEYFLIAYLKKYCKDAFSNKKVGWALLIIGIIGLIAQVVLTNYAGIYVLDYLSKKVLMWNKNCNPFYIMIAIGGLIISLQSKLKSHFVVYVSSLTMFIYLIHENILFRHFIRPLVWKSIYENIGYAHVVLLDLAFAFILFIAASLVSAGYKETINKIMLKVADFAYGVLSKFYAKLEEKVLKIK